MKARFRIYQGDRIGLPEDAIPAGAKEARALLGDLDDAEGAIRVDDEQPGGAIMDVGDTLGVLMSAFCFEGLMTLKTAGSIQIDFFEHEEIIDLAEDGDSIVATGSRIGTQRFPASGYFRELAACGQRYAALMQKIWQGDADRAADLEKLEALAAKLNGL